MAFSTSWIKETSDLTQIQFAYFMRGNRYVTTGRDASNKVARLSSYREFFDKLRLKCLSIYGLKIISTFLHVWQWMSVKSIPGTQCLTVTVKTERLSLFLLFGLYMFTLKDLIHGPFYPSYAVVSYDASLHEDKCQNQTADFNTFGGWEFHCEIVSFQI